MIVGGDSQRDPFFERRFMIRKYFKAIVWALVVAMTISSSVICAAETTGGKQKVDLGYVTPDAVATVVIHPREMLNSPEMKKVPPEATKDVSKMFLGKEMAPVEAISQAGKMFLGIDPLEIQQVLIVAEISSGGPPGVGIVMHMASPVDPKTIFPQVMPRTSEVQWEGKTYRKAPGPEGKCFFCPDDKTVIAADEAMLKNMLTNHAAPKEGKMTKVLAQVADLPDILAILQITPIRPMLAIPLQLAKMPPDLEDAKKLPDLLTSIGIKANMAGDTTISIKANNETDAEQVEKIIVKLLEVAKAQTAAEIARMEASANPMEKAMAPLQKQMKEKILDSLQPVRKGSSITVRINENNNP
jgi:hypothetical protein